MHLFLFQVQSFLYIYTQPQRFSEREGAHTTVPIKSGAIKSVLTMFRFQGR